MSCFGSCYGVRARPLGGLNVLFYKGDYSSPVGSIHDLHTWKGQYWTLERNHAYIQWLFPNYFESQFNSDAHALSPEESREFRNNPDIARKYVESYKLFLDFLGLELKNPATGEIERAPGGERRLHEALVQNTHNQLRIRRVLASLSVTGWLGFVSVAF